jgi:SAM-dependent methyltransferase
MRLPILKHLIMGAGTFLKRPRLAGTGGTDDPDYCYSVWLRHCKLAMEQGLSFPSVVAELGPGDSLGAGIAAVLSGAKKYYALDIADYGANERNRPVYDALKSRFNELADIPGPESFPRLCPALPDYSFPFRLSAGAGVAPWNEPERQSAIQSALEDTLSSESIIEYISRWNEAHRIRPGEVDFVFSQAVMFYVDDLDKCYAQLGQWLKPGGLLAAQIDFTCLYFDTAWYGHWCYPEWAWTALKGRRPYFLNRKAFSEHIAALESAGFEILNTVQTEGIPACPRSELAPNFRHLSDDDLKTRGAYLIARKKNQ